MLEQLYNIFSDDGFFFSSQENGKWIKLSEALVAYFDERVNTNIQLTVKKLLLDSGTDLVELPDHMTLVLKCMKRKPNKIKPEFIANHMRETDCWKDYTYNQKLQKLQVLEFVLNIGDLKFLNNIQIFPLKSRTFIEFRYRTRDKIFVTEDKVSNLFVGLEDRSVSRNDVSEAIWEKLGNIADEGKKRKDTLVLL